MKEELTKAGNPVSEKTFGTMVCNDKSCRRAAVDLNFFDPDLRLYGRYLHHHGYRTLSEARQVLERFVKNKIDPYAGLETKVEKVVDFQRWKRKNL